MSSRFLETRTTASNHHRDIGMFLKNLTLQGRTWWPGDSQAFADLRTSEDKQVYQQG